MLNSLQINKRTRANLESETVCTGDCTVSALKSRKGSFVWAKNKSELNVLVFTVLFLFFSRDGGARTRSVACCFE